MTQLASVMVVQQTGLLDILHGIFWMENWDHLFTREVRESFNLFQ